MGSIIRRFVENSNRFKRFIQQNDVFVILVLCMVSITSFTLGMMYEREKVTALPSITTAPLTLTPITPQVAATAVQSVTSSNGKIIASKNGTRYYFSWCSGVSRIAVKNRVFFDTEAEAQAKGYSKAKGCE